MSAIPSIDLFDKHVVVLINYMRKHHVLTYREFAKRVGKLTILLSTEMEGDRDWEPEWDDLNVVVQKNTTFTLSRSSGFREKNFIHVPWDTIGQLRRLKPDMVLSYEMGARTLLCSAYRKLAPKVPLIMIGNMSHEIEGNRGVLRRGVRRIIRNSVDLATYNGPSCRSYLQSIGFSDSKLSYFPYCFDLQKCYSGPKEFSPDGVKNILSCSALTERKAIVPFCRTLRRYCDENPQREIKLTVAGDGPLRPQVESFAGENLKLTMLGNIDRERLRQCYSRADICVFATFGDEWGLVPMEAWASGVPVMGSKYAQSVQAVCQPGINGWSFDSRDEESTMAALGEALSTKYDGLAKMSEAGRKNVEPFSAANSAEYLGVAISKVLDLRRASQPELEPKP